MTTDPVSQLAHCPNCGHTFDPVRIPPQRKARMVWSNRVQRFVRKVLTPEQEKAYERNGSID